MPSSPAPQCLLCTFELERVIARQRCRGKRGVHLLFWRSSHSDDCLLQPSMSTAANSQSAAMDLPHHVGDVLSESCRPSVTVVQELDRAVSGHKFDNSGPQALLPTLTLDWCNPLPTWISTPRLPGESSTRRGALLVAWLLLLLLLFVWWLVRPLSLILVLVRRVLTHRVCPRVQSQLC